MVRITLAGGCAEYACWWANNVHILGPIDLKLYDPENQSAHLRAPVICTVEGVLDALRSKSIEQVILKLLAQSGSGSRGPIIPNELRS